MLEKIFTRENALQRHRNAPLLQEREEHLRNFAKTRHDYHSLVYRADYLLKVVEYLNLSDDSREPVGIDAVREAAKKWAAVKLDPGKRKRGYPSGRRFEIVATQWLEELGMLDRRDSEGCIFNELLKARKSRLNAIGQPLFDERRRYLEALRSKAYCNDILRMTSAYMLHAIDLLKLDRPRRVGLSEIETAAQTWQGRPSGSGVRQRIPGKDRSEKFIRIVTHWLNFLGWLDEPKDSSPLHAELSGYFDWVEDVRGLSHRTIRSRICVLRRFAAFLSKRKTKLSDLDMETIDAFLIHRASADGCSRRTIASNVTILRGFLCFAWRQGWCSHDMSAGLVAPRQYSDEDIPSFAPWQAVENILSKSAKDTSPLGLRTHAMLTLLATYGMRCSELRELKVDDIDWRKETVFLRRAKGCRPQVMPLVRTAGDAIVGYIKGARHNPGGHRNLFPGMAAPYAPLTPAAIYRVVSKALRAEDIQLKHYGPHCLRHSCATHLVNSGHTLKEVSDILGHQGIDTTRIYAKVDLATLSQVADMDWRAVL